MTTTPLPRGFRAAGIAAGIKKRGGHDFALVALEEAGPAAALFTRNQLVGAHVTVCREHLAQSGGRVRALLVNSGNANCATGTAGVDDAHRLAEAIAERLECPAHEVLVMSTGVIGARLPLAKMLDAVPQLFDALSADGAQDFNRAIMTTDTTEKRATRKLGETSLVGVAKGSGMIHPDMATMLAYLFTDAALGDDAHELLSAANRKSFQRMTVDGDTSPNDTVLLWSSERAGPTALLGDALNSISGELARLIAKDGEGATRLITVRVSGAPTEDAAALVGRVIATSPLVKTAVAGRDPNWGRILSAAGRAGIPFPAERALVKVGSSVVFADGRPHPANEGAAARYLADEAEVMLSIDLAAGTATADVWTCDLTAEYVSINADYRT
ncbi:MAG: bifunctional glutamate N-acetyltransferase/amino-acid acetyltransferase ArgJ [Planctomycetes bacterium]|nr:bifunctional glutamate N-acetyltransferase/amino-acid acetyltransferase ArgJ [Planctomycetota bacterium]MCB9903646.1 bifunctional glutamate N-acetyltransferase/amino-acid acetyltransferase ArgJ [Planctomycetota bacterium]